MLVRIYQIKDLENCRYAFGSWKIAEKNFKFEDYELVYKYDMNDADHEESLDIIYEKFNLNSPEDFKGHSLSMSDVVMLDNDMYYCDTFGWKKMYLVGEKSMDKELYCKLVCALTHNVEACGECRKCEGANCAEIRMNLVKELAKTVVADLPWSEDNDVR